MTLAARAACPAALASPAEAADAAAFQHRSGSASWSGVNAATFAPGAAATRGFAAD